MQNYMAFVHFHKLHLISGITYLIIFVLHQPICRLEKNLKTYLFKQAFPTQTVTLFNLTHRTLTAIPFDCSSGQVGFEPHVFWELATCK